MNSYYNGDGDWKWNNSKEKGIIVKRKLEGGGSNYGETGYDENKIKGNSVEDAGFCLLSCGEAEALPDGIRHLYNDNSWWLRSPGQYDGKAAYCWTDYNYTDTVVITVLTAALVVFEPGDITKGLVIPYAFVIFGLSVGICRIMLELPNIKLPWTE